MAALRSLGAELIFYGDNFDEARVHSERLAKKEGYRYVRPADEPLLISGVATQTLEVIEDLLEVQVVVVPLGGGQHSSRSCLRVKKYQSR